MGRFSLDGVEDFVNREHEKEPEDIVQNRPRGSVLEVTKVPDLKNGATEITEVSEKTIGFFFLIQ